MIISFQQDVMRKYLNDVMNSIKNQIKKLMCEKPYDLLISTCFHDCMLMYVIEIISKKKIRQSYF